MEALPPTAGSLASAVRNGLRHHAAGRLLEASRFYQQALEQDSADADALVLLGLLARQTGKPEAAIRLTALAVRLRPGNAGFQLSLAQAHWAAGDSETAESCCRRLLERQPKFASAWCCLGELENARGQPEKARLAWEKAANLSSRSSRAEKSLGHLFSRQGNFEEAIKMYRAGLGKAPQDPALYCALGAALAAAGRKPEARTAYRKALKYRPAFPEVLLNLGNLYYNEGGFVQAAECCRKALALRPGYVKAWCNLGNALQMLGQMRGATSCYERALAIDPKTVAAHHNMGNAWVALKEYRRAEECFRRTLELEQKQARPWNSLGNALFNQRRDEEAAACYRRAIEIEPEYGVAHTNLGNVLMRLGDCAGMIRHYERAVELDPTSAGGHYNLALAWLRQGRYRESWQHHERRWDFRELRLRRRRFPQPQWKGEALGEALHGETILLHAEQGLGDTLQFVRYAPLVADRGGRVVLEVQRPLKRLLKNLPRVSQVVASGEPLPEFALHCPLMSLPLAVGTALDTIPGQSPYVHADGVEVEAARQRWKGEGLRVGIAWAGNPQQRSDDQRSMPLRMLLPLMEIPGVSWFSLQKGPGVQQMRGLPAEFPLVDASSVCRDLAETAGLIATLDLVISVDTSIAHLAGAMGAAVWVALPRLADWRWMDERDDSPWYATARLFRQKISGDWRTPVERMREELQSLVLARGRAHEDKAQPGSGCVGPTASACGGADRGKTRFMSRVAAREWDRGRVLGLAQGLGRGLDRVSESAGQGWATGLDRCLGWS
jgi:tetratricopeptide (TPR) repeat protein